MLKNMESKNELEVIEHDRNVYRAIKYLEETNNKSIDVYLRVLFILLDFLVDGRYTQEENDFISLKNRQIFNEAKSKYADNDEFLFFSGIMIYIAEWYFGMVNVEQAASMLERAMQSNPVNIIYKWGYFSIIDQRAEVRI